MFQKIYLYKNTEGRESVCVWVPHGRRSLAVLGCAVAVRQTLEPRPPPRPS